MILLTGATGAVGPLVVTAFHDAGYSIRTLSIDPPPANIWPDDVEALIGDVTDSTAVNAAMVGVESVIHLAALLHIMNPDPALREKYEWVNVGGTATIVDAALRVGVRRVVLFSTIAVYGQSGGQVLTEDTQPRPETFYARTKGDAEKIVLAAQRTDGGPLGTVLRLGAVYGPRVKGNYRRLLHALARHRFIPLGPGQNRRTLIYEQDVARATVLAAEHPLAGGKVYNVSDGQFHTLKEIIGAICESLGRSEPHLSLPVGPVRFIAGVLEDLGSLAGLNLPVGRGTVDKYTEDIAVSSERIQTELGFVPQYDLLAGWRETIQETRRAGAL